MGTEVRELESGEVAKEDVVVAQVPGGRGRQPLRQEFGFLEAQKKGEQPCPGPARRSFRREAFLGLKLRRTSPSGAHGPHYLLEPLK